MVDDKTYGYEEGPVESSGDTAGGEVVPEPGSDVPLSPAAGAPVGPAGETPGAEGAVRNIDDLGNVEEPLPPVPPAPPAPEPPAAAYPPPPTPPSATSYTPPPPPPPGAGYGGGGPTSGGFGGSEKQKVVAGILAILLGSFGVHKFYLGYQREGIILLVVTLAGILLSCIGVGIIFVWVPQVIGIVEGVIYLTKSDEEFYQTYVAGRKSWF